MTRLQRIGASLRLPLLVAAGWLGMSQTAWAQPLAQHGGGAFVGSYTVVLLVIALGLLVACHSSRRADRPRMPRDLD